HAQQRGEDQQMVLGGAPGEDAIGQRQPGQQADERRDQEEPFGEDRQAVLGEHPAERGRRGGHERRPDRQHEHAQGRQPPDGPTILAVPQQAGHEDDQQQRPESHLERERRQRAHGFTSRESSGTVAVSTGPSAMPGAIPNSTMTAVSSTIATPSGPRASSRWWKWGEGGPQKICLVTRST